MFTLLLGTEKQSPGLTTVPIQTQFGKSYYTTQAWLGTFMMMTFSYIPMQWMEEKQHKSENDIS